MRKFKHVVAALALTATAVSVSVLASNVTGSAAPGGSYAGQPVDTTPRTIFSVLDANQEVPAITDSSAVGYANFKLAGGVNRVELTSQFWNIDDVVAAHLHLGARGENGPVIVDLAARAGNDDPNDGLDGVTFRARNFTGPFAGMPIEALIAEIEAGNVYINVHTTDHPSGEMRGQLQPTP